MTATLSPTLSSGTPIDQSGLPGDPFAAARSLIRASEWRVGLAAAEAAQAGGHEPDVEVHLLVQLARLRSGMIAAEAVTPDLIRDADGRRDLRVLGISPLLRAGQIDAAGILLDHLIEALPPLAEDHAQRGGVRARQRRWDEAIADADRVEELADAAGGPLAMVSRIQYRLQGGRVDEALALVRALGSAPPQEERLTAIMLAVLLRNQAFVEAADLAAKVDPETVTGASLAGYLVQALLRDARHEAAIKLGESLLRDGIDGAMLRSHLGQAWQGGGVLAERAERAAAHFEAGLALAPDDIQMNAALGDILLRAGKIDAALPYLAKTCELQPKLAQVRALYARALKQAGRYEEASDSFRQLLTLVPGDGGRWQRFAAGALAQAGHRDEAADLFDAYVAKRRAALPDTFDAGLDALWGRLDEAKIPQGRLDWAWSLRDPASTLDRAEWERRAKWGHLADHYLLDWLECRDDQVHEAMAHFADEFDFLEEFTAGMRALSPGKGVVYASAHIGAMYFGPLSLELIGERSRWLASTPSVARTSYAESLISTSDQTDTQVARAFMRALGQDNIVVVVVDGAINLAAPRILFEGREVTYSQFASRTAYRMGSSSAFVAPVWRPDNRLGFVLKALPMPEPEESANDYAARWQAAYFGHLRAFLAGEPQNLRLSGGIWRLIR